MARVNWLGEVEWLGAVWPVPPECSGSPQFTACVVAALNKANAQPECAVAQGGKDACVQYYHQLYVYQDCRALCTQVAMPTKPASWKQPETVRVTPPAPVPSSSGSGWVIAGVVVAGIALAAVALR